MEEKSVGPIYFVIILNQVQGRESSCETINRHIEHLKKIEEEGKLIHGGPFTDYPAGMIIVKVKDIIEATSIAKADPFVLEGVRTYEVRTWLIACKENGYLG